jgi:pimeloyl-ACP methyl ester carboxylesterase
MPVSQQGTAYEVSGPEDAPVVVLIHGLGMNRQITWGSIVPVLADRYRVVSYDLVGHGQSRLPDEKPSLRSLGRQLVGLLDELNIAAAALVGFSLGGMINRRVAMDHPDRVSALVILNSPHERSPEQQQLVEQRARDTGAGGPAATIDATLARWFTEVFRRDHSDVVEAVRNVVLANDHENYALHRQVLAEGVVELIRPVPAISHPALVMTCENDSGSNPEMSYAIAGEIDGAETIIVPGLQHLGLIERPDQFARPVKAFVDGVLGGTTSKD